MPKSENVRFVSLDREWYKVSDMYWVWLVLSCFLYILTYGEKQWLMWRDMWHKYADIVIYLSKVVKRSGVLEGVSKKNKKRTEERRVSQPQQEEENHFIIGKEGLVSIDSAPLF